MIFMNLFTTYNVLFFRVFDSLFLSVFFFLYSLYRFLIIIVHAFSPFILFYYFFSEALLCICTLYFFWLHGKREYCALNICLFLCIFKLERNTLTLTHGAEPVHLCMYIFIIYYIFRVFSLLMTTMKRKTTAQIDKFLFFIIISMI